MIRVPHFHLTVTSSTFKSQIDSYDQMNKKITCLPIDFQYIPVEILSKEFTKLNNPHSYRIHYLGLRFKNTLEVHKKNSYSDKLPHVYNSDLCGQYLSQSFQNVFQRGNHHKNSFNSQFSQQSDLKVAKQRKKSQILQTVSQNINSLNYVERYKIDTRKIAHSYILEQKLKNSQFLKPSVFYRAFEGMNPTLNLENQVLFNSCFEGGNLDCVIKINEQQFDLFLRIDSNTRGHLLWFYFSVKNQQKLGRITMNICNFSKSKTLYKEGLRPYVFSTVKNKTEGIGWQQQGENLGLEKRELRYEVLENKFNSSNTNCLTIEYEFQHLQDEVFFAYCIPYTYSQLMKDIEKLPQKIVEKKTLGKSLLGTDIPILHISEGQNQCQLQKFNRQAIESTTSNFRSDIENFQLNFIQKQKKRVIFATGRIHPSQSNSSYVIMGFIKWLCSEQKQAVQLRKIARFVIVPMVNPDGVIIGNSRTSASGKDLNRQYITPDPCLHPQICLIKQIAKKIHDEHEINLFLDFHGHSRKKNTFFYGPVYSISQPNYYKCRILPKLIEKISNPFRFHSCSFSIIEEKKKTARASMFQNLGIEYTYTVESSIGYFYDSEKLKIFEFSQLQWFNMGESIAKGTAQFIVGIDSYEQFLKQRRKERLRKKKFFRSPETKVDYLEDNVFLNNQQIDQALKLNYEENYRSKSPQKNIKSNPFIEILQQIRASSPKKNNEKEVLRENKGRYDETKDIDIDEDSDSHDQNQDMDLKRLKQFANIIKNQQKSLNYLDKQLTNNEIKLHYENQFKAKQKSRKKTKILKNKIVNEFDLLNLNSSEEKQQLRSVKTGDAIRKKLNKMDDFYLSQQDHLVKQKTLPQDTNEEKNLQSHQQIMAHKFKTTMSKLQQKRNTFIPVNRDKKSIETAEKRQKVIGNYFGEYRLMLEDKSNDQEIKKQKYDIIRKLQSRKQNSRKKRAQSSNQIKPVFEHTFSNQNSTFCRKKKAVNPPQFIHGPTEFTFQIPFGQSAESSKSYMLKPKLKTHLRQKPHSVQNFHSSLNTKERDSSMNMKQKSQKMIQGIFYSQKQQQKDKRVSQSYLIQNGGMPFFNRMSQTPGKNSSRDINRNSKIDMDDVQNTVLINTFKVYQM